LLTTATFREGVGSTRPLCSTPLPRSLCVQTMLGAWDKNSGAGADMGSKLAQRVAVNGLANSYMAFNTNYHDTGGWVGIW
jgi:hypothetical protein